MILVNWAIPSSFRDLVFLHINRKIFKGQFMAMKEQNLIGLQLANNYSYTNLSTVLGSI